MAMNGQQKLESIVSLNKDIEPLIVQNSAARSPYLGNTYRPLQFVHCSDMHAVPELWSRMVEYINHYSDYIDFALHTGDYCGGHQDTYCDFYAECPPCVRPTQLRRQS